MDDNNVERLWRAVPGHEEYEVTDEGEVRRDGKGDRSARDNGGRERDRRDAC